MSPLRIERYRPDSESWTHVGDIPQGSPDASMSSNNPDGSRDIFIFGVDMINRQGYIKKSISGLDETEPGVRIIDSFEGFTTIATLDPSESFEIETVTDISNGEPRRIRFTYLED
jgi:hypothetical protein